MNEYLSSVQEFYKIYSNYIDKYVSRPETDKNHGIMLQTAGEYYEMFQEVLQKDGSNEFLEKSCEMFLKFQDLVMEHKIEGVKSLHMEFGKFLAEEQNKNMQQGLIADIFGIDVEQMKLQNEKVSKCQELVELDMKLHGEVTEMTKSVLDVQHMEIVDGQVKEKINEFIDRDKNNQEIGKSDKKQEEQDYEAKVVVKKPYQATAYLKKTTDKPTVLYGNNPQELLAKLQKWNEKRPEDMKYYTCYMRTLNQETNKYENSVKYDVATGKDITLTYLELPKMQREEFMEVVAQLKADGARFNPTRKQFYITSELDAGKFSKYLLKDAKMPHLDHSKDKVGKPSVMKQLEQNKAKIRGSGQDRKPKQQEQVLG